MSRIILHVGTHKTATTTIQRHLFANRDELKARGIWYPGYDIIGKRNHYAHLGIVNALAGSHDKFSKEDAKEFFKTVARQAQNHDVTMLSAEPFYRHIAYDEENRIPGSAEKYWKLRKKYVEEIRELFSPSRVEVAVVFREQSGYAQSLYQEHVKATRYTKDFRTFLNEFWFHFDYLNQARTWAKAFDSASVMTFDEVIAEGTPAASLGSILGVDLTGRTVVSASNRSLHPDMVILKRMLQNSSFDRKEARELIEAVAEGPFKDRLNKVGRRSFFPDRKAAVKFHNLYSVDNEALRREFREDLQEPIFDLPSYGECKFGDKLSPKFIFEVLKEVAGR